MHTLKRLRIVIYYVLTITITVICFMIVRTYGEKSAPSHGIAPIQTSSPPQSINTLFNVLLALSVIMITARIVGILFKYLRQPPVMGEVVGGILLGPSCLGYFFPGVTHALLPPHIEPALEIIAQLGIILYMFLIGLEIDLSVIYKSGQSTLAISHTSMIVPFIFGTVLALSMYPAYSPGGSGFTVFALFLGVSLSITAFPVLARILTDNQIHRSPMGIIALTSAAIGDATVWVMLAFVVSIAQERIADAYRTFFLTSLFVVFVVVCVQPVIRRLIPYLDRSAKLTKSSLAIIFSAMLCSALATEYIGIHAIFGAFLLGTLIPSSTRIAKELTAHLQDVISVLFLPTFFAFTGMRTQIGLLNSPRTWMLCGLITLAACIGKFGGAFMAARVTGITTRNSAALGVLMNTRGLVEIIVLNIGLDMQIINQTLFTMLILMALITTIMTTPILHVILRNHPWKNDELMQHEYMR